MSKLRNVFFLALTVSLAGCNLAVLNPKGIIAASEKQLLIEATLLMLIVVIPVIFLNLFIAWRFRAGNTKAKYLPNKAHNNYLEAGMWGIPCIIIGILAVMTWVSTHKLDPYKPIVAKAKPMTIQVVALRWKWLFIYPNKHIATVNYLQFPVNVPISFLITADAPMNSFQIPQLAGQIYAMPGMQTRLHVMATSTGLFRGMSTNFSGEGFSGMHFKVKVTSKKAFEQWVNTTQQAPNSLSIHAYKKLALPSENNAVAYFSSPAEHLYKKIMMKFMMPHMEDMGEHHVVLNTKQPKKPLN